MNCGLGERDPNDTVSYMRILLSTLLVSLPCVASVWVQTGQTNAQTQIDLNHSSTWQFTPVQQFTFSGGRFTMKDGSQTFATISLSVYEGLGTNGVLLAQVTQTNAEFCAGTTNCQNFSLHIFNLGSVAMQVGRNYFIALTSTAAADKQSEAYFIKGPNQISFVDPNGNPYVPPPAYFGSVPEPGMAGLLGLSGAMIGLVAYRRNRRAPIR